MYSKAILLSLAIGAAQAQRTTYTGCNNRSENGVEVEYCFLSGIETARATYTVSGTATIPITAPASATAAVQTTAVTDCHTHSAELFCVNGAGSEVQIDLDPEPTGDIPETYTDCHAHGETTFCLDPAGEEVALLAAGAASEENQQCHFHAGVEHCVGGGAVSCGLRQRDYDVGLRIGSIFIVLVTSSIGVYAPIFLNKIPFIRNSAVSYNILMIIKQFGTGIIISTAFIHLYTHADLMFSNECIGELGYEAITSAVVMAGIFICFLIEYIGTRIVASRQPTTSHLPAHTANVRGKGERSPEEGSSNEAQPRDAFLAMDHHHGGPSNTPLSIGVMEAGIIFHSVLIGLTLVVAGDSFYRTLLIVIIFHQFFEGLALGARIALLPGSALFPTKFLMALAFALITPLGMAIGIGVLNTFNGNNPATVLTFGTLDALSAGVLVWVGVVDMWARDWVIEGGELLTSGLIKTLGAGLALVTGMILMGLLGKWA
ncbi:hypothetical protein CERZMDRAFT_41672 [Cercospora zeae-maydis SCOH1-5]|uniref:Uncharacterized protein n=1 Tax=Cercospora zeae-maydis SCOH1-5 TaxID=717836 RepID=A0A6A6FFT0_9PEZI|nr:hypothetical protein CERZMDRAFT_41672 [Cercospora zeae-maydis SCOH1-5]